MSEPKIVTRLIDDDKPYPWGVYKDGKLIHRDGNRASALHWAYNERNRIRLEARSQESA